MQRFLYIEYLRFFAIIAVISIHVVAALVLSYENYGSDYWWFGNFIDGAARWCVPIFVMISGALLLNPKKEESISTFFRKRASRIVIPFLFAVIFYFLWANRVHLDEYNLFEIFTQFLKGPVFYHLWYVYMIVGLLAVTPILRIFIKHGEKKHLELFLGIWLISQFDGFLQLFKLDIGISFRVATDYVGYYVLGYYLHTFDLTRKTKSIIYLLGAFSLMVIWVGTYVLMLKNGYKHNGFFYNYNSLTVLFVSISVFLFMRNRKYKKKSGLFRNLVMLISSHSYGIYLIHAFVKDFIEIFLDINVLTIHPIIGYIISLTIILLISFGLTWIANFMISSLQPKSSIPVKKV